jgi:hypothetical protein
MQQDIVTASLYLTERLDDGHCKMLESRKPTQWTFSLCSHRDLNNTVGNSRFVHKHPDSEIRLRVMMYWTRLDPAQDNDVLDQARATQRVVPRRHLNLPPSKLHSADLSLAEPQVVIPHWAVTLPIMGVELSIISCGVQGEGYI